MLLAACEEYVLYKNIEENEANMMASVLLRSGIEASRTPNQDDTYNIIIHDEALFPEAIDALSLRGFPRTKFENLCTIFKGDGMVSTPVEQKARYTCAKAQELSGSLTELDGVTMARVHLVLSETDPISRKVKPASASVMIKYKPGMDIDTLIPKVKQLISYAVEELPYQNVAVMLSEEASRKEEMIIQSLNTQKQNKQEELKIQEIQEAPEEYEQEGSNMVILYVIMCLVTISMVVLIFFMLRIKSNPEEEDAFQNSFSMASESGRHTQPVEKIERLEGE